MVVFADSYSKTLTDNMQCIYDELKSVRDTNLFFAPEMTGKKCDMFNLYFGFMRFCKYYARCTLF